MKALLVVTSLVAFVALSASAWSSEDRQLFRDWKKKHKKVYRSHAEEKHAMENVMNNNKACEAHNKLYDEGKVSFEQGLFEHSDLSPKEMRRKLLGINFPQEDSKSRSKRWNAMFGATATPPEYPNGPKSIDWTELGLVGPVKNQGGCGSCWAFSTTALVEAALRKRNKDNTIQLSQQQLVDCADGNHGCVGGWPSFALDYVRQNGIASEQEYPYEAYERTCEYNKDESVATIRDVYNVPTRGNETWLRNLIGSVGPASILFCITDEFQNYHGGIFDLDDCCDKSEGTHAPVMTGYGTDRKYGDYWILKNSWGPTWGENGYIRVKRGKNVCNIAYYGVYAT